MGKGILLAIAISLISLSACSSGENGQQDQSGEMSMDDVTLTQVWATGQDELITPECATYDPEENVFYISNLNRDNDAENDGYLSLVNADGSIQNARWVEGLNTPLGNDFHGGYLYVNDESEIVQIDIETGNISDRIAVEGAIDLNGMDIHPDGTIYSADSDGNKIFRVTPAGEVELIIEGEQLNNPNGVFIKETELIIASMGGNSLLSLDLETNELTTLVDGGLGRADGIIQLDGGHYLISSWTGEVYFVNSDMETRTILDTSAEEINAADIGYIPQDSLLVVPTFFDNRLVGYKLSY
jgi:outer membrane protein assembly factor BamB